MTPCWLRQPNCPPMDGEKAGQVRVRTFEGLINTLQAASSLNDLQAAVQSLRDNLEIDHVIYHSVNRAEEPFAALTYSQDWVNRYLEKDYARLDPVVQGCFQRFDPVNWKQLDWSGKACRNFLGEAVSAGVGNQGLSIPIRGPHGQFAMFTICASETDDRWTKFTEEKLSDLLLYAHFINQKALDFDTAHDAQLSRQLSPREIDALSLLAAGAVAGAGFGTSEDLGTYLAGLYRIVAAEAWRAEYDSCGRPGTDPRINHSLISG